MLMLETLHPGAVRLTFDPATSIHLTQAGNHKSPICTISVLFSRSGSVSMLSSSAKIPFYGDSEWSGLGEGEVNACLSSRRPKIENNRLLYQLETPIGKIAAY